MPEGPLLLDLAASAGPPSGMLALQWRLQDGSWKDPSSWLVLTLPVAANVHQLADSTLHAAYCLSTSALASIEPFARAAYQPLHTCGYSRLLTHARLILYAGMRMVQ